VPGAIDVIGDRVDIGPFDVTVQFRPGMGEGIGHALLGGQRGPTELVRSDHLVEGVAQIGRSGRIPTRIAARVPELNAVEARQDHLEVLSILDEANRHHIRQKRAGVGQSI
jgi:hypothetical protein